MDDKQFEQVVDKYISNQESLKLLQHLNRLLWVVIVLVCILFALVAYRTFLHSISVTQVHASETAISRTYPQQYNSQVRDDISLSENASELDQRLQEFLETYHAPFAKIPLFQIGKTQGLTKEQIILLIAITYQESKYGVAYRNNKGYLIGKELADTYANPAGIKYLPACENARLPDSHGMYITKCNSYLNFWRSYMTQMKHAYFDKNCSTSACIATYYVGQGYAGQLRWRAGVNHAVKELNQVL